MESKGRSVRRRGPGRRWRSGPGVTVLLAAALTVAGAAAGLMPATAALTGANADLTRAPYLTDVTSSSVRVTWATGSQSRGIVRYGPAGNCSASQVQSTPSGSPITVGSTKEYLNTLTVTGLTAGTSYCYRVFTASGTDLMGALPSPAFTTLDGAASSAPLSFAVLGDWGDTTNSGVNDGTLNANQAAVDAQIAASGARFAVSTGDLAYPGGSQTNYGDVNQGGQKDVSAVFGPSYWAVPGQSVPSFVVSGNHGQNNTYLLNWPQESTRAGSNGVYDMLGYPSVESLYGTTAGGKYPTSYYAFSANGVRFYLVDASWGNSNTGTATGGACGSHCAIYQVDHDAHWTPAAQEYQWLAADLAAHPGGLKMAFFHFPLRSDDATEPSDSYLQNAPGTSGTLEKLLYDNGVQLAFNGHAHTYQRNVAPPGGVISYLTGGGGAKATSIGGGGCASTDAYAIGWSYTGNKGNKCGSAPVPTSDRQVYHFLKVTVNGSSVTVTPTDSTGATFDPQTYNFGADTQPPTAPGALTATRPSSTKVTLTWTAATDNVGVSGYDVYRDGTFVATVPSSVLTYPDAIVAGTTHTYTVSARDLAHNTGTATVTSNGSGAPDTTPPAAPTGLTASATGPQTASLSWTASTDNVGVVSYSVLRGGSPVATVAGSSTAWSDAGLTPATAYTYSVTAADGAGNVSPAATPVTVTTPADTTAPTAPGTPTVTSSSASQVSLSWAASTDDVSVVRYDVLRGGAVVGTAAGTTFTDTTVAPGSTYSYLVKAYDGAGNGTAGLPVTVTTPTVGGVFSDGFESGSLQWDTVSGLVDQQSIVHTGSWAARETSTGTATYGYKTLAPASTELWAQSWVYVVSRSTSANFFGFRTSTGASIVNLYADASGRLSLRNNIGGVTTNSTTVASNGAWHRLTLHALVNGTASSVDVSLDGAPVAGLSLTSQNFGTAPIAKLQLGETTTARTYDIVLDDVVVSSTPL